MRKTFTMTAIAAAIATTGFVGTAQADVTVFGKAHIDIASLTNVDNTKTGYSAGDGMYVASHASRFGVKASEDLGDGLSAIFHAEFQVDMTNTSGTLFSARNNFAGLKGGFGTVLAGVHDMPYKMSISKADPFADTYVDYNSVIQSDTRQSGVVMYMNKFNGFGVNLAYAPNVNAAGDAVTGASVDFKFGPVDGSVAYEGDAGGVTNTALRVRYDFGMGDVSVVGASENNANNTYASANFKLSDTMKLSAAYGQQNGVGNALTAIGIHDKLGKKVGVYAYYGSGDLYKKAPVLATGSSTAISLGMQYSF
jgi:predicted porin